MDCKQFRDRIEAIALTPQGEHAPEWQEHLDSCSSCREETQRLQEAWLIMAQTLPTDSPSQSLEQALMQRVEASRPALKRSGSMVVWKYALAAGVLFLLASLTLVRLGLVGVGKPTLTDADMRQIRTMAQQMDKLEGLERVFASKQLKYVSLKPNLGAAPTGYLVLDAMSGQIHFFGRNLRDPNQAAGDKTLWVWLYDSGQQNVSSAPVDIQGRSTVGTALLKAAKISDVVSVIVTQESPHVPPTTPSDEVLLRCGVDGI